MHAYLPNLFHAVRLVPSMSDKKKASSPREAVRLQRALREKP